MPNPGMPYLGSVRRPIVTNPLGSTPQEDAPNNRVCPNCSSPLTKRPGQYGEWWGCTNYPRCDMIAAKSKQPPHRWIFSTKAQREARRAAHLAFDALWQNRLLKRATAYSRMAQALGIPPAECHMENFDEGRCLQVIRWSEQEMARHGLTTDGPDLVPFVGSLADTIKSPIPSGQEIAVFSRLLTEGGVKDAIHACLLLCNDDLEGAKNRALVALQKYSSFTEPAGQEALQKEKHN